MKWGAAIGTCVVIFAVAMSASAFCADPPAVAEGYEAAPLVFTGTVISTESFDRVAQVEVDTVWKGSDVSANVTVYGTPDPSPNAGSSLDRTFQAGVRYVFFPISESNPYEDHSCTLTQVITFDLENTLTELADGPGSAPSGLPPDVQPSTPIWVVPALAVALGTGAILIKRRRPAAAEVKGFRLNGDREAGPD